MTPAAEEQLNKRQKEMVGLLVRGESLTSRRCQKLFGVTGPTVASDFALLVKLGLAQQQGKGRSTRYVLTIKPNR